MVVYFSDPGLWKATEGKCEYIISEVAAAGNVPSKCNPWTVKYVEAYKKRWGKEPEYHGAAESYMTPYVLKEAIEKAGTLDSDSVVKALEQTNLVGVFGRIRFDPKTHRLIYSLNPDKGAVGTVFQWQGEKRVAIFPPPIATGEVKLPPWMR
jgi:branched-chain amino acid transport system substrate-binding protein